MKTGRRSHYSSHMVTDFYSSFRTFILHYGLGAEGSSINKTFDCPPSQFGEQDRGKWWNPARLWKHSSVTQVRTGCFILSQSHKRMDPCPQATVAQSLLISASPRPSVNRWHCWAHLSAPWLLLGPHFEKDSKDPSFSAFVIAQVLHTG